MFLLDTNVLSQLRRAAAKRGDPAVIAWLGKQNSADLFISAISLMEIQIGILLLTRRDTAQGTLLREWFEDRFRPLFADRILAIDGSVALRCAELHLPNPQPERDALIAATALIHGFTVVTRNVVDFAPMGVQLINPWSVLTAPN
jgi:predicted nucleic acid-binding protein